MIHTTALENRRAAQHHDVGDAGSHAARPWWRIHPLVPCVVVGAIALAASGRLLLAPEPSQRQPPVVNADADKSPADRLHAVDKAASPDELAGGRVPVAETDALERGGVGEKQAAEGGIGAESLVAAKPVERPEDADGKRVANPKSEQPPPEDAPSPIETGSIKRADDPPATRIARVASDVNMRAGPSNGQSVLATISRGSSVEVISCHQWCEVVFAGQRGWIYRGFIAGH